MAEVFTYPNTLPHASRVSIVEGESVATFANANVAGYDWSGAQLWITPDDDQPYLAGIISDAGNDADYEALELPLVFPWNGSSITTAKFVLVGGAAFASASRTAASNARFRNQTQQNMGLVGDVSDVQDYSQVLNNSFLWNETTGTLYRWRNGTLEQISINTLGPSAGRWAGLLPKHDLSIVTGDVAIDYDDGPNYKLTLSDDAELQLPTNVEVNSTFDVLFVGGGDGNVPTFAAGFTGFDAAGISRVSGARTRLTFIVTAETGGTATAVSVSQVSFAATEIVEDGGYLFRSNVADNVAEPEFIGPGEPDSTASWTWLPLPDGAAGSAVVTGTSVSSNSIGTGTKTFQIVETDPVRGWAPGSRLTISSDANNANRMSALVTSFDGEELVVSVDLVFGSGTHTDWNIVTSGERGETGPVSTVPGPQGEGLHIDHGPVADITERDAYVGISIGETIGVTDDGTGNSAIYRLLDDSPQTWSDPLYSSGGGGGSSSRPSVFSLYLSR